MDTKRLIAELNVDKKLTADLIERSKSKVEETGHRFALQNAREKLGKMGKHIDTIKELIEKPNYYSVKQWEAAMGQMEWLARRLTCVVERMNELRPLIKVADPEPEPEWWT